MAAYEEDYYEYMVKRFFNNSGAYRVKKRSDSESDSDDEEEEEMAEILVITDDIWEGNIFRLREYRTLRLWLLGRTISATLVSNLLHFELVFLL